MDGQAYWNFCGAERWSGGKYFFMERAGDGLRLSRDAFEGAALLPPLDSGESDFRWGRVRLTLSLPKDASVQIFARASDDAEWAAWQRFTGTGRLSEQVRALFGEPRASGSDVWLSDTGRRLWLAIIFASGGTEKPQLDAVSVLAESDHMTDYLPAIYQKQDFTYRFLSIFTAMNQDLEERIRLSRAQLEPASADSEMLRYLAHWLCADESMPEQELREVLPQVIDEYETMYTVEGVKRSIRRLTGQTPIIIEHFQVDPNDPGCTDPELFRRLYGDDPYRFFILLPQGTFSERQEMEHFLEQLEELVPAECTPELVLTKPGVQLDGHSYLGVNSKVGEYVNAVIDELVSIHYDTKIGGQDHER